METSPFQQKARNIVWSYAASRFDATDKVDFTVEDVYVVWFCKTLQNWKALLSTNLPDLKYYEVTHDGDQTRTYLDVYAKVDNLVVEDESYSSGHWHLHSQHTGEVIEQLPKRIPDVVKEHYQGVSSDLESMIPVVMGEGENKVQIGEVTDMKMEVDGIRVQMKLDDDRLVSGTVPRENLTFPGPMSFAYSPPQDLHIIRDELTSEQTETNRFMRNIHVDDVARLGIENVRARITPEFPFSGISQPNVSRGIGCFPPMEYGDTDNGEANKVGFKDTDFGLTDPDRIDLRNQRDFAGTDEEL